MDPLSQLLMLNDMRGYVARDCHFSGEWRSPHAAGEWSQIRWHMVLAGSCRLEIPGGRPVPLEQGSLLFLPHNSAHRLLPEGADSATHLLCGVQILPHSASPLLASLPECLLFNSRQQGQLALLQATGQLLSDEFSQQSQGHNAIVSQTMALLFALAIRAWLAQPNQSGNLVAALLHPQLGNVVEQMLRRPQHPWTLVELSERAHMSRANFARVFRQVTQQTPLQALTAIRMQLAARLLARQALPLSRIAEQAGYSSEVALHKAFTRHFGLTPGKFRQQAAETPPDMSPISA